MKKPYELAELKITWFGKKDFIVTSPGRSDSDGLESSNTGDEVDVDARKSPLEKLLR